MVIGKEAQRVPEEYIRTLRGEALARPLWAIKVLCLMCGHQGPLPRESQSYALEIVEGSGTSVTCDVMFNSSLREPIH